MGAGILPVCSVNGKIYFLMGKEGDSNEWSDFGGGKERKETPFQTALREGVEELNGFLGIQVDMSKLMRSHRFDTIKHQTFTTYMVEIPYDPMLPYYFNSNYKFMKQRLPHLIGKNGLFEKSEIRWVDVNELRKLRRYARPFYKGVIDDILKKYKS